MRIFTQESLTVGVSVWEWLLAERPDLGNRVMAGIGEAWAWVRCFTIGFVYLSLIPYF